MNKISDLASKVQSLISAPRWHYLDTPLTSTSWDGDAYSTMGKTKIDLSEVFGVPPFVRAVSLRLAMRDSGASGGACSVYLSGNSNDYSGHSSNCFPSDDIWSTYNFVCECDANGDIYIQTSASGTDTMDISLTIWGFYI